MKNSSCSAVGIDISSQSFDLFLQKTEDQGIHKVFSNDDLGLTKCISFLKKNHFTGKIVMESTGRYHFLCAVMLKESGFNVFVINPLIVKKYQTASIRKCKTDKQDSKMLAQVALLEKGLVAFNKDRKDLAIRQKISVIQSLEKTLQKSMASFKNYHNTLDKMGEDLSEGEKLVIESIELLKKQKKLLEKEVIEIIQERYDKEKLEKVQSIPGISPFLASLILFFFSIENGNKASKWIAFCGLEISIQESGKWRGSGRLSKRGNKYLRKRLFSGSWGAFMHDPHFKRYYDELKKNGRSHVEALNIISRKMVRIAFSLLKNNNTFDANKCF